MMVEERVPENHIPFELKKRAEQERKILLKELRSQGADKRADTVRLINFYIVPNWNDSAFEIVKTARILTENGFSVSKHKNKIAIANLLGSAVANRVFPDGRVLPKRFTSILEKLEAFIKKRYQRKRILYRRSDSMQSNSNK
ncbi:hypothetical protein J7E55_25885 [Bacillus sp. ISL-53]|nr:hypothetical protein [Bacillus sp. ISL-53]